MPRALVADADSAFKNVLTRRALRRMAGSRYFERGQDYFSNGQVSGLTEYEGTISAKAHGEQDYRVTLRVSDGSLEHSCTCPRGQEGDFCKHCVAVGLAWLAGKSKPEKGTKRAVTVDDIRDWLASRDKRDLVDLLMEQVREDDRLRQRLLLDVAKVKRPEGLDLATYKAVIDEAVGSGFVRYGEVHDYVRGIEQAIKGVEALLKDHPHEVIELAEHAIEKVEGAMGSIDDSDGYMTGVLEEIQRLHLAACRKAMPDPCKLAHHLFEWELNTDYDTFHDAVETYADVLGKNGLATYKELAEAEWSRVPPLGPGQDERDGYGRRYRLKHIMEAIARGDDDLETLVEIRKRDLSTPHAYLQVAETYKKAGKGDLALEWGEKGLKAFERRPDASLREFVADEYHGRKRHDEAMNLVWAGFVARPDLHAYQNLKEHAERCRAWSSWREKALGAIRDAISREKRSKVGDRWIRFADHSLLVEIFLWEEEIENAWGEAKKGGCSNELWMALAEVREKDHPEESLPVYQAQVEPILGGKDKEAYRDAVGLLKKIRSLMVRLGREQGFAGYLESVRAANKRKVNFTKMLDRARWE